MEGKMGVMFFPVKYYFREGKKLCVWKINGDYPPPCDLGGKKMQCNLRI